MINLLPSGEKQNLSEEKKWRMFLIFGMVFIFFLIALVSILFSINVSISSEAETQKFVLSEKKKDFDKEEITNFKREINQANQTLLKLEDFYGKEPSFTGFFEKMAGLLPEGISLDNISINVTDKGKREFRVSLSVHAVSIEDVIKLRENLKNEGAFSQLSFPSSIWAESKDIDFNIIFQAII